MYYHVMGKKRKGKRNFSQSKEYRKCKKYLDRIDDLISFQGLPESLLEHPWTLNPDWIVPYSDQKISTYSNIRQASGILRNIILSYKKRNKEKFRYGAYYAFEDMVPYFSMLYIFIARCFPASVQTVLKLAKQKLPYVVRRNKDTVTIFDISTSTQYIEICGKNQISKQDTLPFFRVAVSDTYTELPWRDVEESGKIYTETVDAISIEKERDEDDRYLLAINMSKYLVVEEEDIEKDGEEEDNNCWDLYLTKSKLTGQEVAQWVQKILTNNNISETKFQLEQNGFK